MTSYKDQYKVNNNFGNINNKRALNKKLCDIKRKEQRIENFAIKRELEDIADIPAGTDNKDSRYNKLLKWKAERSRHKQMEQVKKKPAFKVGVVHHNYYSPPTPPKRITRATQKRPLQESTVSNKVLQIQNVKQIKKEVLVGIKAEGSSVKNKESFAPTNYKFTAPSELSNMPLFGRVAMLNTPVKSLISAKKDKTSDVDMANKLIEVMTLKVSSDEHEMTFDSGKEVTSPKDPVFYSPYIVSSRGKNKARKEQQIRRGINCSPSQNIPTKETVMKTLNISIEEEERTAQYFSFMLNKETDRLNELCKKWAEIQSELDITEDALHQINQAIGQTRLLINKKFERFRGLVLDCETGKGEMLVTCRDLQGFWDMMYMEVMNCNSRFDTLEKLRSNGWKEKDIPVTKVVPKKIIKSKKKIVSKKKSSVQDFILAAKKKMKISQMCKTPKIELDNAISYINSKQTPSKSILKRSHDSTINETRYTRSVQKVNFDDHVTLQEVSFDEEIQNKLDVATRLAKIVNYDMNAEYAHNDIRVEKKLNFDDSSFLDSESNLPRDTEQLNLRVTTEIKNDTTLNLETELVGNTSSKSGDISLKESANKFIQNERNVKVLRNRVVATDNSTRNPTARRSNKGLFKEDEDNQKENKSPSKLQRRQSKLLNQKDVIELEEKELIQTKKEHPNTTPVNLRPIRRDLRRSSRKSVRFNAEECKASTEYKPVHPTTPHTKRHKGNLNLSYLQHDISSIEPPSSNTDLISWDSPRNN